MSEDSYTPILIVGEPPGTGICLQTRMLVRVDLAAWEDSKGRGLRLVVDGGQDFLPEHPHGRRVRIALLERDAGFAFACVGDLGVAISLAKVATAERTNSIERGRGLRLMMRNGDILFISESPASASIWERIAADAVDLDSA